VARTGLTTLVIPLLLTWGASVRYPVAGQWRVVLASCTLKVRWTFRGLGDRPVSFYRVRWTALLAVPVWHAEGA
jgi:hypothetical protein